MQHDNAERAEDFDFKSMKKGEILEMRRRRNITEKKKVQQKEDEEHSHLPHLKSSSTA